MLLDVVIVIVMNLTAAAYKRFAVLFEFVLGLADVRQNQLCFICWREGFVEVIADVQAFPDAAEFSKRSEDGSLHLIKIVVEGIGIFDKLIVFHIDAKLYLAQDLMISDVDEDIVRPFLEAIHHPHKLHVLRLSHLEHLLVYLHDFLLS